jgi:hypothetical protein
MIFLHFALSPRSGFKSLLRFVIDSFHAILCRDGINHIPSGISNIPRHILAQLIDKFMILADGSNTENRFICFSLCFLFYFNF